jgi:hypothetical protein
MPDDMGTKYWYRNVFILSTFKLLQSNVMQFSLDNVVV